MPINLLELLRNDPERYRLFKARAIDERRRKRLEGPGTLGGVPSFYAQFADMGAGRVSTSLDRGVGSATFTRATGASCRLSNGLLKKVASGVARSHYLSSGVYAGYLAEGARTNICLQSEDLATTWTNGNTTESTNATTAPDGTATADKLVESSGTDANYVLTQSLTLTDSTDYTFTVFAKASERTWFKLQPRDKAGGNNGAFFDVANGVVGTVESGVTASIESWGSGWYRCRVTVNASTGATTPRILLALAEADNDIVYTSAGGSGMFFWGAQVEAGSFASSYIPTTTASATRNIDVDQYPTSGNVIAAAGSISLTWTPTHTPSGTVFLWGTYVDASNYTALLHDGTNLIMRKRITGANSDATIAHNFARNTSYKVGGTWGASGVKVFLSGTKGTDSADTAAAQIGSTMQFGADGNGANSPYAAEKDARIWQTQLADSVMASLTA